MSARPRLFIGSSSEGLCIARVIGELLSSDVQVEPWSSAFKLGETLIEGLERVSKESDFAVLLLTDDDEIVSRRWRRKAPRDNVVFELGLFIGRLGRDRCYVVHDESVELKMPTDLQGVKTASYRSNPTRGLRAALRKACSKIGHRLGVTTTSYGSNTDRDLRAALKEASDMLRARIKAKGELDKVPESELAELVAARRFSQSIEGGWWTIRDWDKENSIGFVELSSDQPNGMPKVNGHAYDKRGELLATWSSIASCVYPIQGKLYFNFKGYHHSPKASDRPTSARAPTAEKYLGFSEFTFRFHSPSENPVSGDGEMSDLNETRKKVRTSLLLTLRRCTPDEKPVMTSLEPDREQIARVVQKRLQ